jgi:uncharacterized damage-inducible protein DinB
MKLFFKELFDYNLQSNQSFIAHLLSHADHLSLKIIELQSHIINAHQVWNSRLLNKPSFGVWEIHPVTALQNLDKENYQHSIAIIEEIDLNQIFNYTNTKGQPFSNTVRDILFHVINHSTYHRAQIATECKQNGIQPLPSDFILFKRADESVS